MGRWMLKMELPGRRQGGMPKGRFMVVVRENMQIVCVIEKDAEDRGGWRRMICCGDSEKNQGKVEEIQV